MPKRYKAPLDESGSPLVLLTELTAVSIAGPVIIIEGKAGEYVRRVAVTPCYARALIASLHKSLAEMAAQNAIRARAGGGH